MPLPLPVAVAPTTVDLAYPHFTVSLDTVGASRR